MTLVHCVSKQNFTFSRNVCLIQDCTKFSFWSIMDTSRLKISLFSRKCFPYPRFCSKVLFKFIQTCPGRKISLKNAQNRSLLKFLSSGPNFYLKLVSLVHCSISRLEIFPPKKYNCLIYHLLNIVIFIH